jgi:hypothetical protein
LLVLAFRSLLIALVGAISNIATILVGLGVLTAIFQFGWGTALLGRPRRRRRPSIVHGLTAHSVVHGGEIPAGTWLLQ